MNLLMDIGNSLTKIAVYNKAKIITEFKIKKIDLNFIKDIVKDNKIINCAISNVGPRIDDLYIFLEENTNLYIFDDKINLPFLNPYKKGIVGDDRLALILAASYEYPNDNVLIIDMGTCITYDIKTSKNLYQAGGISPGLMLRLDSLSRGAFNLSEVKPNYPKSSIADDTETSINIGVLLGIENEINGFINNYKNKYNNLKVIISGGDSDFLYGKLKNTIFTNSNFIYKGLNYLIEYNQPNA